MIGFDEAFALVVAAARPLGTERIALADAAGRRLAAPVTAALDAPASAVSTMDGYAVVDWDLDRGFRVVGASYPGEGFARAILIGEAVRIFTGAPVPKGSDRVLIQEVVEREGDRARLCDVPDSARYVRARASDFSAGDVLLPAGTILHPRALVAAAAADRAEVVVWRKPRVAVIATGDELVEPGRAAVRAAVRPGTVPDSISLALAAMVRQNGGDVVLRRLVADDPAAIATAVTDSLAAADLLVMTGGASVGERDHARQVLDGAGLDTVFAKVAIKPGKPVWFGRVGERLVLGLPGNPTSALVTARLFLVPLLAGLGGGDPRAALGWREATLASCVAANGDRETFLRGRWEQGRVALFPNQDSGAQHVLAQAELIVRRPIGATALLAGASALVADL